MLKAPVYRGVLDIHYRVYVIGDIQLWRPLDLGQLLAAAVAGVVMFFVLVHLGFLIPSQYLVATWVLSVAGAYLLAGAEMPDGLRPHQAAWLAVRHLLEARRLTPWGRATAEPAGGHLLVRSWRPRR